MTNKDKYDKVFIDCFNVTKEQLNKDFVYQCVASWDSVGHMSMIAELEETFNVMLEMDEIIDFSSFNKGIEILGKHGIEI